ETQPRDLPSQPPSRSAAELVACRADRSARLTWLKPKLTNRPDQQAGPAYRQYRLTFGDCLAEAR
ncbi:MAG TPA: hypothetical protein VFJ69_00675, partial [Actinomycetota bacterium]|nr:hypothetical protein [Actinomycetota bacterium]